MSNERTTHVTRADRMVSKRCLIVVTTHTPYLSLDDWLHINDEWTTINSIKRYGDTLRLRGLSLIDKHASLLS